MLVGEMNLIEIYGEGECQRGHSFGFRNISF
jgi:hypothetical protein